MIHMRDSPEGIRLYETQPDGTARDVTQFFALYPEPEPGETAAAWKRRSSEMLADATGPGGWFIP